jgi:hypothetical protein
MIKRLHAQLFPPQDEVEAKSRRFADQSYFIGKSQNQPVNLPHFLQLNSLDPATQARPFSPRID